MKQSDRFQESRQRYRLHQPSCHNYQKGLAGFCIHCHKLKQQHFPTKKPNLTYLVQQHYLRFQLQQQLIQYQKQQLLKEWVMI